MCPTGANITTMRRSRFSATRGTCSSRLTLFVLVMNMLLPPFDTENSQKNQRVDGTGQRDDPQPRSALRECRAVNQQNRTTRERQDHNERQQDPEHPLS